MVLYIIQKRGDILRAIGGDSVHPTSCQTWKRILDWLVVGLVCSARIASAGVGAAAYRATENTFSLDLFVEERRILGHTIIAMHIALYLYVIVSTIIQAKQSKRAKVPDQVRVL